MTDDSNNPETEPAVAPGYPAVEVVLKIDVTGSGLSMKPHSEKPRQSTPGVQSSSLASQKNSCFQARLNSAIE